MGTEAQSFPHDCRSMDCRTFRKKHLAFVDDTLPGVDIVQMQAHITACARCAQTDLAVRRSLLVVRNHLSPIEPSSDFSERLSARLERERHDPARSVALFGSTSWTSFAAMCGGVVTIGLLAIAMDGPPGTAGAVRLPAVVLEATPRQLMPYAPLPDATPAFVATVSTGMAILPALLLAEEVPFRTLTTEGEASVSPAGLTRIVPDLR
ncbi:MAG TPA: zf-HC2 domain-containing protein [Woeseiaceae bacterium]